MNKLAYFIIFCGLINQALFAQSNKRKNKDFALFIAVKDYNEWKDLKNPIRDAQAMSKDLRDIYGFKTEVLENPSREEIYTKLEEYREQSYAPQAQLFIFFTGHGEFNESSKEGFFIPKEGKLEDRFQQTYIPHARLERMIDEIPCNHILLAIDACYSGTFSKEVALGKDKGEAPNVRETAINMLLRYKSRLFLTSGGNERTSDGGDCSPFACAFMKALRSFGGKDGILTYNEIYSYLETIAPQPLRGGFGSNDKRGGANFIFIQKDFKAKNQPIVIKPNTNVTSKGKSEDIPSNSISQSSPEDLPDLVLVPGGELEIGNPSATYTYEPKYTVKINDFYIGKHEVTNEAYAKFLNMNEKKHDKGNYLDISKSNIDRLDGIFVVKAGFEKHPVTGVSWFGAEAYCRWLGEGYRLPTNAEWEYAARGGQESNGFKYAGSNRIEEVGWTYSTAKGMAHPVGEKKSNELDIYDMSGNVKEWVKDWYSGSYYKKQEYDNPQGPENSKNRTVRDGSWSGMSSHSIVYKRDGKLPTFKSNLIGFRVAKSN